MQKQKGFSILAVLIIIIAVEAIALGGVFAYQYFSVRPQPVVQIQQNQNINQNQIDQTAGWKTFSNADFSFKYPDKWQVEEKSGIVGIFYSLADKPAKEEISVPSFEVSPTAIYILINTYTANDYKNMGIAVDTIDKLSAYYTSHYLDARYGSQAVFSKKEEITIGNQMGMRLEFTHKDGLTKHYIILTKLGDKWLEFNYDIRNAELMSDFDKILPTFKFTK